MNKQKLNFILQEGERLKIEFGAKKGAYYFLSQKYPQNILGIRKKKRGG